MATFSSVHHQNDKDAMAREPPSLHQRRLRLLDGQPPSPLLLTEGEEEVRDWAGLPRDTLLIVLHRLDDIVEIICGVGHVCRSWRRVTREEPELWRRIDMIRVAKLAPRRCSQFQALALTAVRRSAGLCESFWAMGIPDYYFTVFPPGVTAPMLKSLRLIFCNMFTFSLSEAISKFPLLEELELSRYTDTFNDLYKVCATAAEACPHLKILRLNKERYHWDSPAEDKEAMEIAKMQGLQSLQLFGNSISNYGLAAILDGCPMLESLDICHCFKVRMDEDNMRDRCSGIWTLRLPDDPTDDYNLPFGRPENWQKWNRETPALNLSIRWDAYWDSWESERQKRKI